MQSPDCDLDPLQNMSDMTYYSSHSDRTEKPLVWLHGEVKTPPFSAEARLEAGLLLRRLQQGEQLSMPHSRPMPVIGRRCHELRISDANVTWRIVYRLDRDAVIILEVFDKKTSRIPKQVVDICRTRIGDYDDATS
jgi:phage-related protein